MSVSEMDVLSSLDILELVQLYIVSDLVATRSDPNRIYAALFRNMPHKNIDLASIRMSCDQAFNEGLEVKFLQPKLLLDFLISKMNKLKTFLNDSARSDDVTGHSIHGMNAKHDNFRPEYNFRSEATFSPPHEPRREESCREESNDSCEPTFFMDIVDAAKSSVIKNNNRAVLDEIKRLYVKKSCNKKGPYCGDFETEEDFELHNKLWHSNYIYTECPLGCNNRFLNITYWKEHRNLCPKKPPTPISDPKNDELLPEMEDISTFQNPTRQAKKPDRFSPSIDSQTSFARSEISSGMPKSKSSFLIQYSEKQNDKKSHKAGPSKRQNISKESSKTSSKWLNGSTMASNSRKGENHPKPAQKLTHKPVVQKPPAPKPSTQKPPTQNLPTKPGGGQRKIGAVTLAPWEQNLHEQTCSCDECVTCQICYDRFETKRGLIIHFSRLHRDLIKEPPSQPTYAKEKSNPLHIKVPLNVQKEYPVQSSQFKPRKLSTGSKRKQIQNIHKIQKRTKKLEKNSNRKRSIVTDDDVFAGVFGRKRSDASSDSSGNLIIDEDRERGFTPEKARSRKQSNPKQIVIDDPSSPEFFIPEIKEEHLESPQPEIVTVRSLRCSYEGPYCREFDSFQELDLHHKLYHSKYLAKECFKCLQRFLEDHELTHHTKYSCPKFCPKIEENSQSSRGSKPSTRRSLSEFQHS